MIPPLRHELPKVGLRDDWRRGAVIYQIYPRSFRDTDGDGIGDLPGITGQLEHVADLGADAVWISPFCKSPMKDFGYDVADYTSVDPLFGDNDDAIALIERAHALGLKVLMDFVPSHTSSAHPWFTESREDRGNAKAHWYVWADARPDGTPPNNWLSVFGGVAWEWEPRRGQYYLHNFLKEQPDLNFHEPAVVEALLRCAAVWLERGIDGFRLDAIDFGVHDPGLRDNPPRPPEQQAGADLARSPFGMQVQLHNKARPELADLFFKPLWHLTQRFGGAVLLAEVHGDAALRRIAEYSDGGGVDMAYSFDLLTCPPTAAGIRKVVEDLEAQIGDGWACWSFSNHDVRRAVSRFADHHGTDGSGSAPEAMRAMIPILLASLRGTVCLYQGEDLGLEEAELAFAQLRDPYGITFWPKFKGRDGARTPMPWSVDGPQAGFSGTKPWLPIPDAHRERAVDLQAAEPSSVLSRVRRFLHWRRDQPALRRGGIAFVDSERDVLAFTRGRGAERLTCLFNLSHHPARPEVEPGSVAFASRDAAITDTRAVLPPWGYLFHRSPREA